MKKKCVRYTQFYNNANIQWNGIFLIFASCLLHNDEMFSLKKSSITQYKGSIQKFIGRLGWWNEDNDHPAEKNVKRNKLHQID